MASSVLYTKARDQAGRRVRLDECDLHWSNLLFGVPLLVPRRGIPDVKADSEQQYSSSIKSRTKRSIETDKLNDSRKPNLSSKTAVKPSGTTREAAKTKSKDTEGECLKKRGKPKSEAIKATLESDDEEKPLLAKAKTHRSRRAKAPTSSSSSKTTTTTSSPCSTPYFTSYHSRPYINPTSKSSSNQSSTSISTSTKSIASTATNSTNPYRIRAGASFSNPKPWTTWEDTGLRAMKAGGEPDAFIGTTLGRNPASVTKRWAELVAAGETAVPQDEGESEGANDEDEKGTKEAITPPRSFVDVYEPVYGVSECLSATKKGNDEEADKDKEKVDGKDDDGLTETDCRVLHILEKRHGKDKWLHLQADFYNLTGKLVSVDDLRKKVAT